MEIRVRRWGNSLAIRIPKPFAVELGLEENSTVELSLVNGQLLLAPRSKSSLKLDQLLDQVTDQNLHDEIKTGSAAGREAW